MYDAFKCTEAGPVNRILGIQSHRDWKANAVILEQSQYAEKVLQDYDMDQAIPVSTPIDGYTALDPPQPERAKSQIWRVHEAFLHLTRIYERPELRSSRKT